MHGQQSRSSGPRLAMALGHIVGVGTGACFLARDGFSVRESVLLGCSITYLLRYLLTSFVILQRGVGWAEAAQVTPFLFAVQASFGYLGSRSTLSWGWFDWMWLGLYVGGSFLNTGSELQRKRWKLKSGHKGHLYTRGLFSLSMHVNYFGDALLFTGFALLTGSAWAVAVPVLMTTLFVCVHIPTLDRHLAAKYPEEFAQWARRSKKFIPFIY